MKKLYFILPLIGAVVFYFFYSGAKAEIQQNVEQRKREEIRRQEERAKEDVEKRKKAFETALIEANRKIALAEERKREEAEKAAEVQAAKDSRDLVYRERERQYRRLMELTEGRTIANEQLTRIQEQIKLQQAQIDYLQKARSDVVQNKASFERAITEMDNSEKNFQLQETAARLAARKG